MSTDWWINFNHMEGLTDRCYRVTLSHESQSGDSLGEIGFSERKQSKSMEAGVKKQNSYYVVFSFLRASLFLIACMFSFLPDSFDCICLASYLFLQKFTFFQLVM